MCWCAFRPRAIQCLARVIRIRNQEYLFIDTVDEQYARLSDEMAPTYNLWRQYGAEQAIYQGEYSSA